MKESKEFNQALLGTVNSIYQALEDGKFDFSDIQYFIDDIGRWQRGVDGFKPPEELRSATSAQMDELKSAGLAEMASVPEDDRYDISALTHGLWAGYRMVSRKSYKQGERDTVRRLIQIGAIQEADEEKVLAKLSQKE